MNIIVTGASGFIGGHIARDLADQGHQVIGLNRSPLPKYPNIRHIPCDLTKRIPKLSERIDVIIHSAALADYDADYDELYQANVTATQNIFKLAQEQRVKKLIHISSASVYREFADKYRVSEDFPLATSQANHYAYTKKLAEDVLHQPTNFPVICLRPHIVYGAGDTTVLRDFLTRVRFKLALLPISQSKEVSATHVDNIVAACAFLLNASLPHDFQVFNIADRLPIDCVTFIKKIMNIVDPEIKVVCVPEQIGYGLAAVSEKIAQFTHSRPVLTADVVHQLNHHSSLSQTKLIQLGFKHPSTLSAALPSLRKWWQSFDNIEAFMLESKEVWPKLTQD